MKKKVNPSDVLIFGGLAIECIGLAGCFILRKVYESIEKKEGN